MGFVGFGNGAKWHVVYQTPSLIPRLGVGMLVACPPWVS